MRPLRPVVALPDAPAPVSSQLDAHCEPQADTVPLVVMQPRYPVLTIVALVLDQLKG